MSVHLRCTPKHPQIAAVNTILISIGKAHLSVFGISLRYKNYETEKYRARLRPKT